jgi:hypothetical protein
METDKKYYNLYIKYKTKYFKLKVANKIQIGGYSDINVDDIIETINKLINKIEETFIIIKEKDPDYKFKILSWRDENIEKMEINKLVDELNKYLESNDIPLNFSGYPFVNLEEVEDGIVKFKEILTKDNLENKYKLRKQIYSLDESNYNEISDSIIAEFDIREPKDVEKIFKSTILGYNKNYIIGYIVLLKFLIKNKIQLSTVDNPISFLSWASIFNSLNNLLNDEEYIGIMIGLIREYIKTFPIKKVIQIRNPPEMEKIYGFKSSQLFEEISEKLELIDSYDSKNKVIIYKSGLVKDDKKTTFDDIKQILNTLFRIPKYPI